MKPLTIKLPFTSSQLFEVFIYMAVGFFAIFFTIIAIINTELIPRILFSSMAAALYMRIIGMANQKYNFINLKFKE